MISSPIGKRAVVVGAGMGGLTAAGALADRFEQVLVLERDALPADAIDRSGIPQGKHVHALLAGGLRGFGELFPGFEAELARAGAVTLRAGLDVRTERPGYDPFPQRDLGFDAFAMSRPLLEWLVRERVRALPNVELRQDCWVEALVARSDGAAVTGVRYGRPGAASEVLDADLVVDASGRGSLTLDLLESIGQPRPEESTIGVDLRYASAVFSIPDDVPADWKGVFHFPHAPRTSRGALLLPLEGRRWIVTLAGRHGEDPPGDAEGFMTFVRQLRTSTLCDAICRFNPVYGQGMSVAAQEAVALGRLLSTRAREADPLDGLALPFFAEAAALIDTPWFGAVIPDFVHPKTRGTRPENLEAMLKFGTALVRLAARDPAVHRLTAEVQNLLKSRSAYLDPELVQRIQALTVKG